MRSQWRVALILGCIFGALLAQAAAFPAVLAAQAERCFPETGKWISGRFRSYWEQQGGLPVFGFPITRLSIRNALRSRGPPRPTHSARRSRGFYRLP